MFLKMNIYIILIIIIIIDSIYIDLFHICAQSTFIYFIMNPTDQESIFIISQLLRTHDNTVNNNIIPRKHSVLATCYC